MKAFKLVISMFMLMVLVGSTMAEPEINTKMEPEGQNGQIHIVESISAPRISRGLEVGFGRRAAKEVVVSSQEMSVMKKINYTEEDLYWMARIIYAESRGEDDKGQLMVGEVIMNRVRSERYPNNVKEVIFQGNGAQFEPVVSGTINLVPDEKAIKNAKKVLNGESNLIKDDILYFNAISLGKKVVGTKWWTGVYTAFVYGGHVFAQQK